MPSSPFETFRLTFLLPRGVDLPAGRHTPADFGCSLDIRPGGVACISGPSREQVFDHAALLLKVIRRRRGFAAPAIVAVTLTTPSPQGPRKDAWTAIVGAEVAFSPTGMPPHIPPPGNGPDPPRLRLVGSGPEFGA